jgi:hypothetical protein
VQIGVLTVTGEVTDIQDMPEIDAESIVPESVSRDSRVFTLGQQPTITFTFEHHDRFYVWLWLMIWKRSIESLN